MGRLSTRSNPTSLQEIDKKRVGIVVSIIDELRYFNLHKLDLDGMKLSPTHRVVCIARAGKTSQRFEMGSVAAQRRETVRRSAAGDSSARGGDYRRRSWRPPEPAATIADTSRS